MENNKYTLNIYPRAQADLENIFQYISEDLYNPNAAAILIDEIDEALELICLNPLMCPLVRSRVIKDKTLRKIIVKNYIIFYRPVEQKEEIQVVRELYGMMDYEKIL
ncbi:MAG: type II toxin-antitoxin system RelE/ParE family toxin [Erysipelotrichaceae bacterium]|nr:type II toxin-antitoxin system RelE/ParE family toxin [Erysipelotrichaceae bacterium]